MYKLEVQDLHKRYGSNEVLKGVSLAAKAGDVERFKNAPHLAPMRRLDETLAARKPRLAWRPEPTTVAPAPLAAE